MPKAINSRALTREKPCINMVFHAPLIQRFLTFYMQDSGQYSINTEEASSLDKVTVLVDERSCLMFAILPYSVIKDL